MQREEERKMHYSTEKAIRHFLCLVRKLSDIKGEGGMRFEDIRPFDLIL